MLEVERHDRAAGAADEGGEEREAPVDRPQQLEEQEGEREIAERRDEIGGEAEAEERFGGAEIGGRRRRVAPDDERVADRQLGEDARGDHRQIEAAREPRRDLRPRRCS